MIRSIRMGALACSLLAPATAFAQQAPATSPTAAGPATPAAAPMDLQAVVRPGTDVRAGRVATVINASFDTLTNVLLDFSRYREFLPQVAESRVIQRRHGQVDVYFRVPLLDNLGQVWSLVRFGVTRSPSSLVIDGQQVQGNMRRFEYRIEAEEIPGTPRTRVTLQLLGLPGLPLPTSYLTNQHGRWAVRGMTALRARSERAAGLAAIGVRRPPPGTSGNATSGRDTGAVAAPRNSN